MITKETIIVLLKLFEEKNIKENSLELRKSVESVIEKILIEVEVDKYTREMIWDIFDYSSTHDINDTSLERVFDWLNLGE